MFQNYDHHLSNHVMTDSSVGAKELDNLAPDWVLMIIWIDDDENFVENSKHWPWIVANAKT